MVDYKAYDILKELFNISVGNAASILSEIVKKKILLDVPEIKIIDIKNENFQKNSLLPLVLNGTLMVSSISFTQQITGKANLIFPADKMKTFINLCLDNEEVYKFCEEEFTDIDFDVIKEIGNIILNAIIGELGNNLNVNVRYTLPNVKVFNQIDFKKDIVNENYPYMLMLYITFIIDDVEIQGAVIVNLTLNSLNELIKQISKIEDDLYE